MKRAGLVLGLAGLVCYPLAHAQQHPATDSAARTSASSDSPDAPKTSGGVLSSVSRADRKLYIKLAEGNLAEIAASKQALVKSNDQKIKTFAQHMIDDHGMALEELSSLARNKQIELPSVPDEKHRKMAERMADMSPIDFNSQYAKAAVVDHRATLKLLDKITSSAKDEDLKALAEKMKPKVQSHLKAALELTSATSR
jgi:putative membrane protein